MESTRNMTSARRIRAIDGLRGIAAAAVLLLHFLMDANGAYPEQDVPEFGFGHYGVQLFFMISGFVILLTVERKNRVADFAFSRFARLYPAYWATIAIAYVLITTSQLMPSRDVGRLYPLVNLTMLQQAFGVIHYVPAFWTLYVELQFYALVAALLAAGLIHRIEMFMSLGAIVGILGTLDVFGNWSAVVYAVPLVKYAHLFLFGICVLRIHRQFSWRTVAYMIVCIGNAICMGSGYAVTVFCLGVVFLLAAFGRLPVLASAFLMFVGSVSYSLYLLHQPIGGIVIAWCSIRGFPWVISICIATVLAVAAAILVMLFVEKPANRILMSWWNRRCLNTQIAPSVPGSVP